MEIEKAKEIIEAVRNEVKNGWGVAPYDWGVIDDALSTVIHQLEKEEALQKEMEK